MTIEPGQRDPRVDPQRNDQTFSPDTGFGIVRWTVCDYDGRRVLYLQHGADEVMECSLDEWRSNAKTDRVTRVAGTASCPSSSSLTKQETP